MDKHRIEACEKEIEEMGFDPTGFKEFVEDKDKSKEMCYKRYAIEPKVKPLVDVLNKIPYIETFSSCQGHFEEEEHKIIEDFLEDRNRVDVRFNEHNTENEEKIELFFNFLSSEFNKRHEFYPVQIYTLKEYTPDFNGEKPGSVYIIQLKPRKETKCINEKREILDTAIMQATQIVKEFLEDKSRL